MAAGLATLTQLKPEHYEEFDRKANRLAEGYLQAAAKYNIPLTTNRAGAMFGVFFTDQPVTNFEQAKTSNLEMFRSYYQKMAARGIFLPPSQFEGLFLSTVHSEDDIERTIEAVELTFKELQVEFNR